jgi:Flp pilus assembly protein TadG
MAEMNRSTPMLRRLRSERGAELIEFALVLPLLLLVMMGIVDFGFLFQRYEVLTNAAREGARLAVLPGGYGQADVSARVCAYLNSGGVATTGCPTPTNPVVTLTDTNITIAGGVTMQAKQVQVTYTHSYMLVGPILSFIGGGPVTTSFPITTVAIMRKELAVGP